MALPANIDALSPGELKALVLQLLGTVAELERTAAAQREEITRLKGLKGRPALKPSGMEKACEPKPSRDPDKRASAAERGSGALTAPPSAEPLLSKGRQWRREDGLNT